jgi:hypothetical protein
MRINGRISCPIHLDRMAPYLTGSATTPLPAQTRPAVPSLGQQRGGGFKRKRELTMSAPNTNGPTRPKKMPAAHWYLQQKQAERDAAKKAMQENGVTIPATGDIDPELRNEIEKDLGRALGREELFLERLRRPDMPAGFDVYDRIGHWQPPMKTDVEANIPLAKELAEAIERAEAKKLNVMPREDIEVYTLRKQQAKLIAEQKAKAEYEAWLASPEVAKTLERLKDLDLVTALDPSWNWDQTVAIARAIHAIQTSGVDTDAALALAKDAFNIDATKRRDAMTKTQQEIAVLQARIDAEQQQLIELGYAQPTKPAAESSQQQATNATPESPKQPNVANNSTVVSATPPPVDSTGKYRNEVIRLRLLDAAKPKAFNDGAADLLVQVMAKTAVMDESDNVVVQINGQKLTPDQAMSELQKQPADYGRLFKVNGLPFPVTTVTRDVPGVQRGPVDWSKVGITPDGKGDLNEVLKVLKADPELAPLAN